MNPVLWAILVCVLGGAGAGWVSGKIMSGEGRDLVMDVVMGLAGGLAGGFIAGATGQRFYGNLIYIGLAAIVGSIALTILSRVFGGRPLVQNLRPLEIAEVASVGSERFPRGW